MRYLSLLPVLAVMAARCVVGIPLSGTRHYPYHTMSAIDENCGLYPDAPNCSPNAGGMKDKRYLILDPYPQEPPDRPACYFDPHFPGCHEQSTAGKHEEAKPEKENVKRSTLEEDNANPMAPQKCPARSIWTRLLNSPLIAGHHYGFRCTTGTCGTCPDHQPCGEIAEMKKREAVESEERRAEEEAGKGERVDTWPVFLHDMPPECSVDTCETCPNFPGCNDDK